MARQCKKYIVCNAFSLSMLDRGMQAPPENRYDVFSDNRRCPHPITLDEIHSLWNSLEEMGCDISIESAVGHADTAEILGSLLGRKLDTNRVSIVLDNVDVKLIVGQYKGPRLPEGTKVLPEGAVIEWWIV